MASYWLSEPWFDRGGLDQLRRGMDELFERWSGRSDPRSGVFPPVNLYETAQGYALTTELPGLRSGDIEITVESNRVTLRGERKVEYPEAASLHRVERPTGAFRRTIQLPVEVDAEKASAIHRNGVLMLSIPKAPRHQPRRINVKSS